MITFRQLRTILEDAPANNTATLAADYANPPVSHKRDKVLLRRTKKPRQKTLYPELSSSAAGNPYAGYPIPEQIVGTADVEMVPANPNPNLPIRRKKSRKK